MIPLSHQPNKCNGDTQFHKIGIFCINFKNLKNIDISVWQNILNSSSEILHVGFLKKDLQTLATRRQTFNSFKVTVNTISFF